MRNNNVDLFCLVFTQNNAAQNEVSPKYSYTQKMKVVISVKQKRRAGIVVRHDVSVL